MRLVTVCMAVGLMVASAAHAGAYAPGNNRFLFLDDFLLERVEGAKLTVNPPTQIALAVFADKPWERGGITSYGNVLYDPELEEYRLYYVPVAWDKAPGALHPSREL